VLQIAIAAPAPGLSSTQAICRLTNPGMGNVSSMVRSAYGSTVQRLAARQLDATVPASAHNAGALRGTFRRWVDRFVDDDTADDLTLAVYEALTNAAEHAFPGTSAGGLIRLAARVTDNEVIITISDNGRWRSPTDSGGYRGRGLPLIHQLTTEAHLTPSPYGTTVQLRRQRCSTPDDRLA
jgi:serine/threonine-protein kinase RsbW